MFEKPNQKQSFPALEHEIIAYWKKMRMFEKSLEKTEGAPEYVFYDGPPFATGLPHYGHILAGTLKDVVPRYQTMKGRYVPRRWGWDCHGLPIENLVEQELGLKDKKAILDFGVDKFNEACRSSVLRYVKDWGKVVERMGRWVDFEDSYKTMDPSFMESIWWVFKTLWDKKLIYRGKKTMHICPRCETPLSNFEVGQGYKDVKDQSVIWKFRLVEPATSNQQPATYLLAWTTTPWSTLSTMGLSINPKQTYVKVRVDNEFVIFAKDRMEFVLKDPLAPLQGGTERGPVDPEIVAEMKGSDLVGKKYHHIAPWYGDLAELKKNKRIYQVYSGDYVEVTEGTGIVTINGAYGEIDLAAAKKNKLPVVMDVGMDGKFKEMAGPFAGMNVKEAEPKLVEQYTKENLIWRAEKYIHSYPHCWRCETPLLNYCTDSWFVAVEKIKKKMLKANNKIHWVPEHIKHGRFGKWLENARDWAISRNRYWGTPLPVWEGSDAMNRVPTVECLGSIADLRTRVPSRFTKLTLVRHGESEGNLTHLRQALEPGTALTKKGREQSEHAAKTLAAIDVKEPFDLLMVSPLLRTQQTADIISKKLGLPIHTDPLLREINFGESEGKEDSEIKDEIARRHALSAHDHYHEKIGKFGESHAELTARALEFLKKILREHSGKSILVVTHSDIIRFLSRELEGKSLEMVYDKGHVTPCSPKELYLDNTTGQLVDLHKHIVDTIEYDHPQTGELMKRVPEVLDCWFESGSMPYAQEHYPFENKEKFGEVARSAVRSGARMSFANPNGTKDAAGRKTSYFSSGGERFPIEATFPANFIAEGLDQTRGWFYTLTVLAAALFDQPAFQNIIVNGIVLAEDGQKMSKRKKNYPDPSHIFETYGVDAMRLYLMNSPVVKAEDFRFSEKGVKEVVRSTLLPLWNAYTFFLTYANIDGWKPKNQIYFVRHGQTAINKMGGVQGQLDEPLNDTGRDQVKALAETVKNLPIDVIVTSPFLRARETAEILNADLKVPLEEDMDLREQSYGEWEGKTFAELKKLFPKTKNIHFDLRKAPPAGETLLAFEKRVLKAVKKLEKKYAGKNILMVSHAGVDHVLQKRALNLKRWTNYYPHQYRLVKNASLTVFPYEIASSSASGGLPRNDNALDRWISSELHTLMRDMTAGLDSYDLNKGLSPLVAFIDSLTNWYIRRSRRRFWKSENDGDKAQAYQTLYTVLVEVCKLLAPFSPFVTEAMYRNLTGLPSVHLANWPVHQESQIDEVLNSEVDLVRRIVTLGHSARAKAKVKVRQPLGRMEVVMADPLTPLQGGTGHPLSRGLGGLDIIQEELNVKEIVILSSAEGRVKTIVKPNARVLGPIYGAKVQDIIREAKAGHFKKLPSGNVEVLGFELSPDQIEVSYETPEASKGASSVEADEGLVVILDTAVSPELLREGYARELVRAIQDLRKQADLNVSDHIRVGLTTDNPEIQHAIGEFQDFILKETLASEISAEKRNSTFETVADLSGHGVVVTIEKA